MNRWCRVTCSTAPRTCWPAGVLESPGRSDGRAVVDIQRFGVALNLNVHLHALVLDGMFTHADHDVVCHPVQGGWNQTVREDV